MQEQLAAFQKSALFSREELLASFAHTSQHIRRTAAPGPARQNRLALCARFAAALAACKIPALATPWWYYEYEFVTDGIVLNLCTAEDVEVDPDTGAVASMTTTVQQTLFGVTCPALSVEEFAALHRVSPATVRRWLARGRLRSAKLRDGVWRIPDIQEHPCREYEPVQYLLEDAAAISIDEFPLVAACDSLFLIEEAKGEILCRFSNYESGLQESMTLSRAEAERLEAALIASGRAKPCCQVNFVPGIDRSGNF